MYRKRLIATLITLAMLCAMCVPMAYGDTKNHWAEEAIDRWSEAGVVQGDQNGNFNPDETLNRASLATMLANYLKLTEQAENAYTDLKGDEWYASAILKCTAAGILQGSNGLCNPDGLVTRQEAAVMLARALKLSPAEAPDLSAFPDGDSAAAWAAASLATLVEAGILSGTGAGELAPGVNLNRASAVKLLDNAESYLNPRPIVLQGAMGIETTTMAEALTDMEEVVIGHYSYFTGKLDGYPVVVSRTEQGMVNATSATIYAIEHFDPIAVINQGTSGGHDPDLHTMDIVIGKNAVNFGAMRTVFSEQGAGVDHEDWEQLGLMVYENDKDAWGKTETTNFPGDAALLAAANSVKDTYTAGKVVEGTIGSADEWNNQVDRMLMLHERLGTSVEEMETAAVAQVCTTYDVPFLGIRILSNTGIHQEDFNPASGVACQNYVLTVARAYIDTLPAFSPDASVPTVTPAKSPEGVSPILLQGAMGIETTTMVEALENMEEVVIGHYSYFTGTLNGYPVVVSRTEQGMANATASTLYAIEHFAPAAVLNQGTSGGHDPDLHTMDIVIGKTAVNFGAMRTTYSAEGAGVDYKAWEQLGLMVYENDKSAWGKTETTNFPADAGLLAAANSVKATYTAGKAAEGTIGSADQWNNQIDRMLMLHERLGTSVEEMETAAVAQVCTTYGVPFLGVRILSNTGIHQEDFNPASGVECQKFVLTVAEAYIKTLTAQQAA